MSDKPLNFAREFLHALPHAQALDMQLIDIKEGAAEVHMPYDERFIGDPETKVISGGAVSALLDTCCGAAVFAHPQLSTMTATLDLRIDYMRAAVPGQTLRSKAEVYHVTRTVAFVRAKSYDDDPDHPVATATGAFTAEMKS